MSNNVYSKAFLDLSHNQINKQVMDLSDDVDTFILETDSNFVNINNRAADISRNVINLDSSLRSYVDGLVSGLDVKHSVKAATTDASNVNLTLS